jgi:putative ABC transport system permease protein
MTTILIRLAFAGLRNRLLASTLTIALSATVAATVVIALEVGATARDPWQRTFDAAHGADVLAYVPTEADAQTIARGPGVSEAGQPIPSGLVRLGAEGNDVQVELAGLDARPSVNVPVSTEGVAPGGQGLVLERSFAQALCLRPGTTIELSSGGSSVDLDVVGTAVLPSQPRFPRHTPGLAWVDRATLERLLPNPSTWHWSEAVRLQDPLAARTFVDSVAPQFGPGQASFATREDQRTEALLDAQPIALAVAAYALVLMVLALAVVVILVGARAREQYREIGLLKAIGLTPRQVSRVFAIESASLGLIGVLLGFGVGSAVAPRLAETASQTMLGSPTIAANPWHALIAGCPVLLVLVTGTWASTRRRTRLGVIHAIQAGTPGPASRTLLVRSVARWSVTPAVDLGLRSMVAVRSRAYMLMAALTVTGAAVVFALSMQASLNAAPTDQVSDVPDSLPILVYTLDAILIVIASQSLIAVALLSIRERVREFGVLKTLGFTPGQITMSLTSSHALLALLAGVLSVPLGIALYVTVYNITGGSSEDRVIAPWGWLTLVILGLVVMAAAAISIPARFATRAAISDTLRYE